MAIMNQPLGNAKPSGNFYARNVGDVPSQKHWAILHERTIMAEGYDKGDPSTREQVISYQIFFDPDEWATEVKKLAVSKSTAAWKAIVVDVPTITTTVEVSIK